MGDTAVARETCYNREILGEQKRNYNGLYDVNVEREANGDTFACIEFVWKTQNGIVRALASRTDAIGGENPVYCYSVEKNAWGSGTDRQEALESVKTAISP